MRPEIGRSEKCFVKSPEELLISEEENDEILQIVASMDANYQDIIRL